MDNKELIIASQFKRLALKLMALEVDLTKFTKDIDYAKETLIAALNTKDEELRVVAEKLLASLQGGSDGNDPPASDDGGGDGAGGGKYVRGLR